MALRRTCESHHFVPLFDGQFCAREGFWGAQASEKERFLREVLIPELLQDGARKLLKNVKKQ